MLFGFDDSLKELKREWKDIGVDMSLVREWQKFYEKIKKQAPQLENQYFNVKEELEKVHTLLKDMEKLLISCQTKGVDSDMKKQLIHLSKEIKKYQGAFQHEFLICERDTDFHTTYASILSLCGKNISKQKDVLILQSEVENLIALVKEALEKDRPDFRAMAFFYIEHTDKEIMELPHVDKVEKISTIYENEFLNSMRLELVKHMDAKRIEEILEVDLWK